MSMKSTGAKQVMGNRTGMQTSPELAEELIEGASRATPSSEGGPETIAQYRAEYIAAGFPIGSMPMMPVSEEAEADEEQAGMAVMLDKLSERLAFERMGTRLYEALFNKVETLGEMTPGPTLDEIKHIGQEELEHFLLLNQTITELGGDPTMESPCADVSGVASMGILQVLTDPRTSVTQCLQVLLTAELTDNAGWELLIELADGLGFQEMKAEFETALANEEEHLQNVRNWVSDCVLDQAQAGA
jgi:bacterioferritin (cytochrome b1)